MDDILLDKLKSYVYDGGRLMISYAQFNYTDRNDEEMVFPQSKKIKDFIGLDICGCTSISNKVKFSDQTEFNFQENLELVMGNLCGARPMCVDENGCVVVYENTYGKGRVYFVALKEYIKKEDDVHVLSHVLDMIGKQGDIKCNNNNVSFTVRKTDEEYLISVLNMNCLENSDEDFNISFNRQNISGNVKVGEIKEFILKKL